MLAVVPIAVGVARVDLERDPVRAGGLVGQRPHRRREAVIAEHDRLEREREVAQLPDRRALAERAPCR